MPEGLPQRVKNGIRSIFAGLGTPVKVTEKRVGQNSAEFIVDGQASGRPASNLAGNQEAAGAVSAELTKQSGRQVDAAVIKTAGKTRLITWQAQSTQETQQNDTPDY